MGYCGIISERVHCIHDFTLKNKMDSKRVIRIRFNLEIHKKAFSYQLTLINKIEIGKLVEISITEKSGLIVSSDLVRL